MLTKGVGGLEALATMFRVLRARVSALGMGRLHLNACAPGVAALATARRSPSGIASGLGLDSVTSYSWADDFAFPPGVFPAADYDLAIPGAVKGWTKGAERFGKPLLLTVAMG